MPSDVASAFLAELPRLAKAVRAATGAPAVNIIANNGRAAGQEVFHSHFHVIPRFESDGIISWARRTSMISPEDANAILKKVAAADGCSGRRRLHDLNDEMNDVINDESAWSESGLEPFLQSFLSRAASPEQPLQSSLSRAASLPLPTHPCFLIPTPHHPPRITHPESLTNDPSPIAPSPHHPSPVDPSRPLTLPYPPSLMTHP